MRFQTPSTVALHNCIGGFPHRREASTVSVIRPFFLRSNSFLNYYSLGVDPAWRRHRQTARYGTTWHTAFHCMLRVAIGGHTSLRLTGPSTMARDVAAQPFAWLARADPPHQANSFPSGEIHKWAGVMWCHIGCVTRTWHRCNVATMQRHEAANSIANIGHLRPAIVYGNMASGQHDGNA